MIKEAVCYMCWSSTSPSELIAPCACTSYVHRDCLERWRATSSTADAPTHCPTCRLRYVLDGPPALLLWVLGHSRLYIAVALLLVVGLQALLVSQLDVYAGRAKATLVYVGSSAGLLLLVCGVTLVRAALSHVVWERHPDQSLLHALLHHVVLLALVVGGVGCFLIYLVFSGQVDILAPLKARVLAHCDQRIRDLRPLRYSSM
ncbi:hypothetical protein SPRG_10105 [Saprolegnia parasitica CBS 223.65]|uniref:Uncharacterized protein n=1 Tax=Saprolegnia parasitica (strain CBS 223.65) TaxID=695850 RepID=A0A067C1B9_SAPPC|nr:hypothetical protein SPRG_10105 [Saprolegnia parasitica CBS 223.65]KDO24574.1 hypothetical protein SPRG_10105 [Saprolegnia parasitica CBS 223.65]|eukprot:XP_012204642.1 hypothetical protein SPRG_10105 [Saprolegnia parasitica CBS 223.65]